MRNEQIEAKVKATNRRNVEIFNIVPAVFTALAPFIGQKVELANGGLTQKVQKALPTLPNTVALFAHYNTSHGYSFKVNIRTSENIVGGSGCVYSEAVIYIGDLSNGILTKIYEQPKPEDWPHEYTLATVLALEEEIRKTESTLSTLRSRLQAITA